MSLAEHEQGFVPVEIILKEDETNIVASQNKSPSVYPMTPKERIKLRRQDPAYREVERLRQRQAMQIRRKDPSYVLAERQSQRWRMRLRRSDPQFRERERLRQRERMQLRRMDPQLRDKERQAQKSRRKNTTQNSFSFMLEKPLEPFEDQTCSQIQNTVLNKFAYDNQIVSAAQNSERNNFDKGYNAFIKTELFLANLSLQPASQDVAKESEWEIVKPTDCLGCPVCGHLFQSRLTLQYHRKSHDPLLRCHICEKTYTDRSNLSRHVKHHNEEYSCPQCSKVFHMKQHLKEHLKSHGEKGLFCPHCSYKTCYKYALKRHVSTQHSANK